MVATVAVVARNRETYTCTVGQIVVVVAVVARTETSTQIVAVFAINQDPFYTGKYSLHVPGQIFERTNCFPIQPVYAEPCKFCYSTACTSPYKFCQSQLWNGFLIKGAELGSTLLTRKLCKKIHGRTDGTCRNFLPTADQVKNLHGSDGPASPRVYTKCGSVQGFVRSTLFPDPRSCMCVFGKKKKKKKNKMSVSTFLKIVY